MWVYWFIQEWSGLRGLTHISQPYQIPIYILKGQFLISHREYNRSATSCTVGPRNSQLWNCLSKLWLSPHHIPNIVLHFPSFFRSSSEWRGDAPWPHGLLACSPTPASLHMQSKPALGKNGQPQPIRDSSWLSYSPFSSLMGKLGLESWLSLLGEE